MGRYDFAPQNVAKHAKQLLDAKRIPAPPPWMEAINTTPPSTRLIRPAMQRPSRPGKKPSRLFKPLSLKYAEDQLRWDYYNDHPWELARPRVILEDDGRDRERWDWSLPLDYALNRPPVDQYDELGNNHDDWTKIMRKQASRPINGESVIQRWHWLLANTDLSRAAAYDKARKEHYRYRHRREVQARVAREEALHVGAYFGLGPLEVGEKLEDAAYEDWKEWAIKESQALKALQGSAYTGIDEDAAIEIESTEQAELQEVESSVPGSRQGQTAGGGAAFQT